MLWRQQVQKVALAALLGVAGSSFLGLNTAVAADPVAVSVSRIYVCEEKEGERDLGVVQIIEGEDYTGAISSAGETIEITLPDGVSFRPSAYRKAGWSSSDKTYQDMQIAFSGNNQTVTIQLFGDRQGTYKDSFQFPLYVEIEDAPEGDLYLELNGLQTQISSQKVQFARISDKGITAECIRDFAIGAEENGYFIVRLTEKVAGSIDLDATTIRLTLPEGFSFDTSGNAGDVKGLRITGSGTFEGTQSLHDSKIDDNQLTFSMKDLTNLVRKNEETRGILEIYANVTTDASVESGAVTLDISGNKDIEDTSVTVGQIGNFQVYTSVTETPTVLSGGVGQKLGTLVITEEVPGSLVAGENIRITFPEGVKIAVPYDMSQVKVTKGNAALELVSSDESKLIFQVTKVDSEGETRIEIPFNYVNVQAGFTGDITIEMSGRAGVSGTLVIGEAAYPMEISIDQVNRLEIGKQNQALGTITIKENQGGALKQGEELIFTFPNGIQLQPGVKVEVTKGNAVIDSVKVIESTNRYSNAALAFTIKSESSKQQPSTIEIRNAQVTVSSLMSLGDVKVDISGGAVVQSYEDYWYGADALWNYHDYPTDAFDSQDQFRQNVSDYLFTQKSIGEITVGRCEDAVVYNEDQSIFRVDSTAAVIQGEQQTMPVMPYIDLQSGRTMLPVRYVAYACGVEPDGVQWDAATQTVTLTSGNKEVQLVIGEKTILIDGDMVQEMDVAPEITSGYTFLPARYVAEAFQYEIGWEATTQTITIEQ